MAILRSTQLGVLAITLVASFVLAAMVGRLGSQLIDSESLTTELGISSVDVLTRQGQAGSRQAKVAATSHSPGSGTGRTVERAQIPSDLVSELKQELEAANDPDEDVAGRAEGKGEGKENATVETPPPSSIQAAYNRIASGEDEDKGCPVKLANGKCPPETSHLFGGMGHVISKWVLLSVLLVALSLLLLSLYESTMVSSSTLLNASRRRSCL